MLLALEKQYEALEAEYGSQFSAQSSIASLVDMVSYNGSALYADGENGLDFTSVRKTLIDSIVMNDQGIGFVVEDISVKGSTATISYYVAEGCSIYIGDALQTPVDGCKYVYELDLEVSPSLSMTIKTADGTTYGINRFISYPTRILQDFEDAAVLNSITLSSGGTKAMSTEFATEGSSAHITLTGKVTGNALVDAAYVPAFAINTAALNGITNLTEVGIMNLDIYNASESNCKVTIKIYSGISYVSAGEYTLDAGKNTIGIAVSALKFSAMNKADRIVFEFENTTDGVTANSYDIYLDNMIAKD